MWVTDTAWTCLNKYQAKTYRCHIDNRKITCSIMILVFDSLYHLFVYIKHKGTSHMKIKNFLFYTAQYPQKLSSFPYIYFQIRPQIPINLVTANQGHYTKQTFRAGYTAQLFYLFHLSNVDPKMCQMGNKIWILHHIVFIITIHICLSILCNCTQFYCQWITWNTVQIHNWHCIKKEH